MKLWASLISVAAFALFRAASAAPLSVDLTQAVPPPTASPYGPGTAKDLQGRALTLDSRSFFLGGKPWIPVVGEFHYARYPQSEWREELLKMKAGGINTVSTYVFWNHHEEAQGQFDWSGRRSLRDFLTLCRELGLKAFVRMGPWVHGEARNGGFPDWVQNSGTGLRSTDPRFLALVEPFYREQAKQMQGLLWKDGGPVIGVQMDNECDRADYLLALKKMAQADGVDVPFYSITGWPGGLPKTDLIPLFGGYSDGFWTGSHEVFRREYLFTDVRETYDLGAELTTTNPANSRLIAQFPYGCVEIGGGMASSYDRRINVVPANIGALALSKIGSGSNMPGYYMYQGGTNPDSRLSTLQEDHPNRMPIKDYDFQAPLGADGQIREQYHLLRQQNLFLQDFGPALARMPAFFPDQKPRNLEDFDTLRWDVRSDGKSGFLFFDNQQPYEPLPDHKDLQFDVKTTSGPLLLPRQPVTLPSGSYGFFPFNLNCNGVLLEYATAQPLFHLTAQAGGAVYFFTALDGISPELMLRPGTARIAAAAGSREALAGAVRVYRLKLGTTPVVRVAKSDGTAVSFVVLTPEQGRHLWRMPLAGRDSALLSSAALVSEASSVRLQSANAGDLSMSVFPHPAAIKSGTAKLAGSADGIFVHFSVRPLRVSAPIAVTVRPLRPAGPNAASLNGTDEKTWDDAAVYKMSIPAAAAGRHLILNINYIGDAARLYVGDELFDDNFYNGDAFALALWRIPPGDWPRIRLKILPYSDGLMGRLPDPAKAKVNAAKAASKLGEVTVTPIPYYQAQTSPFSRHF